MSNRFFRDILIDSNDLTVYELSENQGSPVSTVELRSNSGDFVSTTGFAEIGENISGTSFPVSVNIPVIDGNLEVRFRIERVDAPLGNVLDSSAWSGLITTSGIYTETLSFSTAWSTGDYLRVTFQIRRAGGHGNVAADISVQDADSFVDVEFDEPIQESSGGSEAIISISAEGNGLKSSSGDSEPTVLISAEGGGSSQQAETDLPLTDGLVLDLDATKLNLNDDDPVELWEDSSGQGNDATQETSANRPTFKDNVLNGLPAVRFRPEGVFLESSSFNWTGSDISIFSVIVPRTYREDAPFFHVIISQGTWTNVDLILTVDSRDGEGPVFASNDRATELRASEDSYPVDEGVILTAMGESGYQEMWTNGVSFGTQSETGFDATGTRQLYIGDDAGGRTLLGDIAQIAVYNRALTTQEREDVENHLTAKWIDDTPSFSGGSEASVIVSSEAVGEKNAINGNDSVITTSTEQSGVKTVSGSSESAITISSEGAGIATETASGGSESTIIILNEGEGVKSGRSPPTDSEITISSEGNGIKTAENGTDSHVHVSTEGIGEKETQGGTESEMLISAEGAGQSSEIISGGSQSVLNIDPEGVGSKIVTGGSESTLQVDSQGVGQKLNENGSESVLLISAEGSGSSSEIVSGGSQSVITVSTQQSGIKSVIGRSESNVTVSAEGGGVASVGVEGGSEAQIQVDTEALGVKSASGGSQSEVQISVEGSGFAGEPKVNRVTFRGIFSKEIKSSGIRVVISKRGVASDSISFSLKAKQVSTNSLSVDSSLTLR